VHHSKIGRRWPLRVRSGGPDRSYARAYVHRSSEATANPRFPEILVVRVAAGSRHERTRERRILRRRKIEPLFGLARPIPMK
jgi:hypothetical protein